MAQTSGPILWKAILKGHNHATKIVLSVISIEKSISLYIQKYRFEQYENNQDKYHEKLVLQRKVERLRAG